MADARISQLPVEIVLLSDVPIQLRLSQLPVEALILDSTPIQLRLSQLPIEILINTSVIPPVSTETTQFIIVMP